MQRIKKECDKSIEKESISENRPTDELDVRISRKGLENIINTFKNFLKKVTRMVEQMKNFNIEIETIKKNQTEILD